MLVMVIGVDGVVVGVGVGDGGVVVGVGVTDDMGPEQSLVFLKSDIAITVPFGHSTCPSPSRSL